jgi:ribosomal protein S17E
MITESAAKEEIKRAFNELFTNNFTKNKQLLLQISTKSYTRQQLNEKIMINFIKLQINNVSV